MSSEQASGHIHDHAIHDHGTHNHAVPDPGTDMMSMYTPEFWDDRYRSADMIWSGHVNAHLAATASDLRPGTALDVGCGEGGDAIWLAEAGWHVTAIDVSVVALDRAAARAAEAGDEIAGRITWQAADVLTWKPGPQQFDLVSAQFLHLPRLELESLLQRLTAAVRAGGTLLMVAHHPSDLETSIGRPRIPGLMFTAEQMAAVLDARDWDITAAAPERPAIDPDGQTITIRDALLRAVRR